MSEQQKAEVVEAALSDGWLDDEGYPTELALERIERWQSNDTNGCLEFVRSIWSDYGSATNTLSPDEAKVVGVEEGHRYLRLATGGWSGNESLLSALKRNRFIWLFTWRLSASGGLYIFRYLGY
jgi:hypothetical protein